MVSSIITPRYNILERNVLRWFRDADAIGFGALWLFIFSIPWEYQVSVPLIGTISRLFGAIATASGLLTIIAVGRIRLPGRSQVAWAFFFGWACLSYSWSINPLASAVRIGTYVQLFVMALLIWHFSLTMERHRQLLRAYVFGSFVSALSILNNLFHRKEFSDPGRYTAGDFGPNELAITLAWTVPIAMFLSRAEKGRIGAALLQCHLPAIAVAILLTASRGGTLTLIMSLVALVPYMILGTWRQRAQWLLPIAAAVAVAVAFVPSASLERLFTIRAQVESGNLSSRGDIWKAGWRSIDSRTGITGIGTAAYAHKMASTIGVELGSHNSFLSILVDTGIVGIAIFAFLLFDLGWRVKRMEGNARWTWAVVLASWTVGVLSMNGEALKATWVLFSFVAGASALRSQRMARCAE